MTDYPRFVEDGRVTATGQQLVEWVEAQYAPYDKPGAEANIAALNSMAGPVQEYYTLVGKMGVLTAHKWLEGFSQSARNAYDLMKYVEERAAAEAAQTQQVQETASKTSGLEAKFNALQESLGVKVAELEAENARLAAENAALQAPAAAVEPEVVADEPAKAAKKAKKDAAPETEADTDAAEGETPAESE